MSEIDLNKMHGESVMEISEIRVPIIRPKRRKPGNRFRPSLTLHFKSLFRERTLRLSVWCRSSVMFGYLDLKIAWESNFTIYSVW